jgi:hypothetical protein
MHTRDKADDRSKCAQRHDPVAAPCRANPSATSGNLVWRFHSGAMQTRQPATCRRFRAGTGTVRALDFPLAECVEGIGNSWTPECVYPKGSDEGPIENEVGTRSPMKLFFNIALSVH